MVSMRKMCAIVSLCGLGATSCVDDRLARAPLGETASALSEAEANGNNEGVGDQDVGVPQREDCDDIAHCEGSERAEVGELGRDPAPEPYVPAPAMPCSSDDPTARTHLITGGASARSERPSRNPIDSAAKF
jgi:hypothetical protein